MSCLLYVFDDFGLKSLGLYLVGCDNCLCFD